MLAAIFAIHSNNGCPTQPQIVLYSNFGSINLSITSQASQLQNNLACKHYDDVLTDLPIEFSTLSNSCGTKWVAF